MRTSFLYAGCVMLVLAAGPALAQDAFSSSPADDTTEMLNDPVPLAKSLTAPSPSALAADRAVVSPAAQQTDRTMSCTPENPCAVTSPLAPVKAR